MGQARYSREEVVAAVKAAGGNKSEAGRKLGIHGSAVRLYLNGKIKGHTNGHAKPVPPRLTDGDGAEAALSAQIVKTEKRLEVLRRALEILRG